MGCCGSSQSTTVKYPEPSQEEKDAQGLLWQFIQANLAENYNITPTTKQGYKNPERVDALTRQIKELEAQRQQMMSGTGEAQYGQQVTQIQAQINSLRDQLSKETSGDNLVTSTVYEIDRRESPEIEALKERIADPANGHEKGFLEAQLRKLRSDTAQYETDKVAKQREVETAFLGNVQKLLAGDYSITDTQKEQIQTILGDNFDPLMDLVTAKYATARDNVDSAITRLQDALSTKISEQYGISKADLEGAMKSARLDLEDTFRQQTNNAKNTAALLGRSFSDSDFQRSLSEEQGGALQRLLTGGETALAGLGREALGQYNIGYSNLGASAANSIANLGMSEAGALGNIGLNRALLGSQLYGEAAQPLTAFNAGSVYTQLQNALNSSYLANQNASLSPLSGFYGSMVNQRAGQATTTQQSSPGFFGALGGIAGMTGSFLGIPGVL